MIITNQEVEIKIKINENKIEKVVKVLEKLKVKIINEKGGIRYIAVHNDNIASQYLCDILNKAGYKIKIYNKKTDLIIAKNYDYFIIDPSIHVLPKGIVEDIAIITNSKGISQIRNDKGIVITNCTGKDLQEIKKRTKQKDIRLKTLDEKFFIKVKHLQRGRIIFDYIGESFYLNLEIKSKKAHDAIDAGLAIAAAEELGVEEEMIRNGLKG